MIPTTPTGMLREVLGTIADNGMKMAEAAMGMNVADVETRFDVLTRSIKILSVIENEIMKERAAVVDCAKCARCFDLDDREPSTPYSGKGDGSFHCGKFNMDFYAPNYRAETWFCADGIPREIGGDWMK